MKIHNTIISLIAVLSLCSCNSPQQKLIGDWIPSVNETKKLNEKLFKSNPFLEMGLMIIGSMRLNFTQNKLTIEMAGDKKSQNYNVISSAGQEIKIKMDVDKSELTIKLLSPDRLIFPKDSNESFDIVFEKIN